jgi:ParB family chromosome partitioning protein
MERRALGKGIGALIPEKESAHKEEILFVAVESIRPNPFQPREDFDPESITELAQSIKEKGVIQPLLVRRKGDNFELIAGERRLRAAKSLGINELPIIVRDVKDQDSLEIALIENIQRQELNPIEEAHAYQHLMDKFQVSQDKISEVLGKSKAAVSNTLRLLRLPHEIQQELKKGRITFAHGRTLLEIEDENRQRHLVREIITKGLSVRELENLIKMHRPKGTRKRSVSRIQDPLVAALEERLQHALATKVRVIKQKKRGRIVVEFYSDEDLKRITERMTGGR